MTPQQPTAAEERPDPQARSQGRSQARAWTPPPGDQRRHYRPEDAPEETRPVFTDWASI